ncbi:hypothetical protein M5689_015957 [Euphorbia peplus]|nr:hypothetical protein M5689_015957 [Euphorbia peplus]
MQNRRWEDVVVLYSHLVNAKLSIYDLFGGRTPSPTQVEEEEEEIIRRRSGGRWDRVTFKIVVSYHGPSFDGWQKQPGFNTVQELVESSLGRFVDDRKAHASALVAGRTDKRVSALHQVCSFYTWRKDIHPHHIQHAINASAPGKLRVLSVSQVSRAFHPNFSAKWRRYFYIFPLNDGDQGVETQCPQNLISDDKFSEETLEFEDRLIEENADAGMEEVEGVKKPRTFSILRVNQLLQQLERKLLSYKIFARDTKASRNVGPPTECFIYHARAAEARLPCSVDGEGRKVMCIELVANRFLRKMVRVLVATAIREAAAGAEDDALIKLMDASCRRASAPPAPPDGLCMVDVGYTEFDPQSCIIH